MSESVGRAGFNVRHLRHGESGTRGDRASILRESMRELDPEASAFYAAHNPNIVAHDTRLNVAMVNDGQGGFRRAKNTAEVLAYGDARIGTSLNPEAEDRVGNTGRKWNPQSYETTLIVVSLPRSMCIEVPGVYPVLDDDGQPGRDSNGNPAMRSRWVARDRDEALRYFAETVDFLGSDVFTGGVDAIHGYDVNLDEAYPHMQLAGDTLADNPKKPGVLRVEAQQMWGVSSEVLDHRGKIEQPEAKMTRYQKAYREHMHGLGYEVELEVSERSKSSHTREEWAALKERTRVADANLRDAEEQHQTNASVIKKINEAAAAWNDRGREIEKAEAEIPKLRSKAKLEGHAEGISSADAEVSAILTAADSRGDEIVSSARITALQVREDAEREAADIKARARPEALAQARAEILPERGSALALAARVQSDGEDILKAVEVFVPKDGQKRDHFNNLVAKNKQNKIAARNSLADLAKSPAPVQRQTQAQRYGLGD